MRNLVSSGRCEFPGILKVTPQNRTITIWTLAGKAKNLLFLQWNGCEPARGRRGHCDFAMRFLVPLRWGISTESALSFHMSGFCWGEGYTKCFGQDSYGHLASLMHAMCSGGGGAGAEVDLLTVAVRQPQPTDTPLPPFQGGTQQYYNNGSVGGGGPLQRLSAASHSIYGADDQIAVDITGSDTESDLHDINRWQVQWRTCQQTSPTSRDFSRSSRRRRIRWWRWSQCSEHKRHCVLYRCLILGPLVRITCSGCTMHMYVHVCDAAACTPATYNRRQHSHLSAPHRCVCVCVCDGHPALPVVTSLRCDSWWDCCCFAQETIVAQGKVKARDVKKFTWRCCETGWAITAMTL